jgi:hypothetical protein
MSSLVGLKLGDSFTSWQKSWVNAWDERHIKDAWERGK